MKHHVRIVTIVALIFACYTLSTYSHLQTQSSAHETKSKHKVHASKDTDIATAVKAASVKDCGCGECAAKGCKPCHGKNCFYCAAKGLTTKECGCGMCTAEGCTECGPSCDVCKFHLKAVADARKGKKSE